MALAIPPIRERIGKIKELLAQAGSSLGSHT